MDGRVIVDHPEQMNLLGLLLRGYLEQRLEDPGLARRAQRLRGSFGVQAGAMAITLTFSTQGVTISRNLAPGTRARIVGPLGEMVRLVTAGGSVAALGAVIAGRVSIGGNPLALLGLLPLMTGRMSRRELPPPPAGAP